jgi:hypothetical protein
MRNTLEPIHRGTRNKANPPHSQPIPAFTWNVFGGSRGKSVPVANVSRRNRVVKTLLLTGAIATAAMLAAANIAAAADMPHPQPVYQTGPVGKGPIGKGPIGKSPVGKAPYAPYH